MSRFSGAWAALKCMHETVESTGVVDGKSRSHQYHYAGRFSHAAGRPEYPVEGYVSRAGSAPARFQARRHARLRARQQAQQDHHLRRPQPPRSASSPPARLISTCGRPSTNSGSTKSSATISACASSKSPACGRSAAQELTEFAQGLDLIIVVEEKRSLIEVQVREELYGTANQPVCIGKKDDGQLAVPGQGRARPQRHRHLYRRAAFALGTNDELAANVARLKYAHAHFAETVRRRPAHPLFLLRLSAQYVHAGAGRHTRLCRHRLPLHGAVDGPQDARLHADGRRRRQLDRRSAFLKARSRFPKSRRRHLQPLRLPRDPRGDRLRGDDDLQDPVQRRRRHDRRPGERRRPDGAADCRPGCRRRGKARWSW